MINIKQIFFQVVVGCGVNLSNKEPTKCINQMALELKLNPISREMLLARIFNILESFLDIVENGCIEQSILEKYYKYWLHDNQDVKVRYEDGVSKEGKVVSLDNDGFLQVEVEGHILSVHPDGNSFDMLQGLIIPKN